MLSAEEFGRKLILTKDLDPVYCALWNASLPKNQLMRLILAYSCFYHLGVASKISELSGNKFWDEMDKAAVNTNLSWPRNSERRHFRGGAAISAVSDLKSKYKHPEKATEYWFSGGTFTEVSRRVRLSENFGPWIAFKLADMADRLHWPVDFSNCELGVYKDPKQGAAMYKFGDYNHPITTDELSEVIEKLVQTFKSFKAPPKGDRRINVQEVESVLCKWKSYMKGHYHIGHDIAQVRKNLEGWGNTAKLLLKKMPKEVA